MMTGVVSTMRVVGIGAMLHAKAAIRSPFEVATIAVVPIVQATIAIYLFRAATEPHRLIEAAVGAGLMGIWSTLLFGAGAAVQQQRWLGTLEMLMIAPRPAAMAVLPVTISTTITGTYTMIATLIWGRLLYGVKLEFASPGLFVVAVAACVLGLGMSGLLLASTFVLLRNANALCNALEYPIWLLSGMLVPITVLPAWSGPISAVLPTTWGARAVQQATSGGPVWPSVGWCLLISAIAFAFGMVFMTRFERRARADATLSLS